MQNQSCHSILPTCLLGHWALHLPNLPTFRYLRAADIALLYMCYNPLFSYVRRAVLERDFFVDYKDCYGAINFDFMYNL